MVLSNCDAHSFTKHQSILHTSWTHAHARINTQQGSKHDFDPPIGWQCRKKTRICNTWHWISNQGNFHGFLTDSPELIDRERWAHLVFQNLPRGTQGDPLQVWKRGSKSIGGGMMRSAKVFHAFGACVPVYREHDSLATSEAAGLGWFPSDGTGVDFQYMQPQAWWLFPTCSLMTWIWIIYKLTLLLFWKNAFSTFKPFHNFFIYPLFWPLHTLQHCNLKDNTFIKLSLRDLRLHVQLNEAEGCWQVQIEHHDTAAWTSKLTDSRTTKQLQPTIESAIPCCQSLRPLWTESCWLKHEHSTPPEHRHTSWKSNDAEHLESTSILTSLCRHDPAQGGFSILHQV